MTEFEKGDTLEIEIDAQEILSNLVEAVWRIADYRRAVDRALIRLHTTLDRQQSEPKHPIVERSWLSSLARELAEGAPHISSGKSHPSVKAYLAETYPEETPDEWSEDNE